MIVVATEHFEIYHEVTTALRDRDVVFTTIEPGEAFPSGTRLVIAGPEESPDVDVPVVQAAPEQPREAVGTALSRLRGEGGRTVVGVDPGERPGIAVLDGDTVVAAFQVPVGQAAEVVAEEVADAPNPLVRIGDGARLLGARLIDEIDAPVELVDETGTTPHLGSGARGMDDVLAAVNIARMEGERIESREIEPTAGEIQRIKDRSREASEINRAIPESLARRVAIGDLTVEEALAEHASE